MCSFVVSRHNGFELFLASSVPHLQFNHTSVGLHGSNFEVNTDGGEEVAGEEIVGESHKKARFANTWVADEENFEDIVELVLEHV